MATAAATAQRTEAAAAAVAAGLQRITPGAGDELIAAMEAARSPEDKTIAVLEAVASALAHLAAPAAAKAKKAKTSETADLAGDAVTDEAAAE